MRHFADYPETTRLRLDIDLRIESVYNNEMDQSVRDMHLYVFYRAKDFLSRGVEGESSDGMKWSTHPNYALMREWLNTGLRTVYIQVKQLPDNKFKKEDTRRFHAMCNAMHTILRLMEINATAGQQPWKL